MLTCATQSIAASHASASPARTPARPTPGQDSSGPAGGSSTARPTRRPAPPRCLAPRRCPAGRCLARLGRGLLDGAVAGRDVRGAGVRGGAVGRSCVAGKRRASAGGRVVSHRLPLAVRHRLSSTRRRCIRLRATVERPDRSRRTIRTNALCGRGRGESARPSWGRARRGRMGRGLHP